MDISEISQSDMASLTAQGYTEQDLAMLAKTEVDSLLAVSSDDDNTGGGDHDRALAEQDASANPPVATNGDGTPAASTIEAPSIPQFKVEVPADAKDQIAALKLEDANAFKRLMDGEIDADEYQATKARTEEAIDELRTQAITAKVFEQANQQTAEQAAANEWKAAESAAFNSFKAEGLDYKGDGKAALLAAYNFNLKALGQDPKNEHRDAPWFLAEAHRLTKEALGFVPVRKNNGPGPRERVDVTELPPTLRNVPTAATGAINTDEFAHMRNLDGLELERAHARLTPEQRDRYMAE